MAFNVSIPRTVSDQASGKQTSGMHGCFKGRFSRGLFNHRLSGSLLHAFSDRAFCLLFLGVRGYFSHWSQNVHAPDNDSYTQ